MSKSRKTLSLLFKLHANAITIRDDEKFPKCHLCCPFLIKYIENLEYLIKEEESGRTIQLNEIDFFSIAAFQGCDICKGKDKS